MAIPLDEVVTFDLITRGSGGVTDADSAPTYDIFEDTTDTPILAAQTMTKRTSLTGNYRGSFTASAANGFEAGKWYNVIGTGIVGGIIDKTVAMTFMLCAAESAAGVPKVDAAYLLGTAIATPATAGILDVNAKNWGNVVVTGMPMPTYTQPTGFLAATFPGGTIANTTNITAGTITTVTTLTNLPSIPANWLTAAGINAGALNGKGDWLLASSYTAPPTVAAIATGVWQDSTAGDFTVASSIGKSLYINNVVPGAAGGHFIAGTNAATVITGSLTTTFTGNLTGSVNSVTTGVTLAASQHVIVDSGTVTTLTNLPSIPANWLTAAGINADAFTAAKFASDVGAEFADAIWDEVLSGHLTAGTTGNALNAAGSAGDPWGTALPGAYGAGTAGAIVGAIPSGVKLGNVAHGGSSATFRLGGGSDTIPSFYVTNALGTATQFESSMTSGGGAPGLVVIGSRIQPGAQFFGGTFGIGGDGVDFIGGGTAGYGVDFHGAAPDGYGISATSIIVAGETELVGEVSATNALNDIRGMSLTSAERTAVADALLGRNIKGGSSTGRIVTEALAASRNKVIFDVPGAGQFTVMDTDDTTPLWIGTYTRGANTLGPLTAVDPT